MAVLEKSIRVWHQNRTCYSCHHQGLAIALVAEARTRGIVVDDALARTNISVGLQGLKSLDRAVQAAQQIDPAADTGSQLVAAKAAGVPRGLVREVYAATVAKRQRPDGGWETLDNRPPQAWSRVIGDDGRAQRNPGLHAREQKTGNRGADPSRARLAARHTPSRHRRTSISDIWRARSRHRPRGGETDGHRARGGAARRRWMGATSFEIERCLRDR